MNPSPRLTTARPSNPDELNSSCINLLQALKVGDGGFVAVVGAGPSSPMIPRGNDLIEEMRKACGLDDPTDIPFWDFYESAKEKNREEYCRLLKDKFNLTTYWRNDIYDNICNIPFKTIITTNYDHYLPKSFAMMEGPDWKKRFCVYPPRKDSDSDLSQPGMVYAIDFDHKKYLVAIHGYKDQKNEDWPLDSIILSKSDYMLHYFAGSKSQFLYGWWKQVLSSHNCLFIGTSLQEPGIGKALLDLGTSGAFERQPRQHLQLIDASLSETEINGVKQPPSYPEPRVLYDAVQQVQFDPKNSFEGLLDVLSNISGKYTCNDFEPGMTAPTFPSLDSLNASHVTQ
jgi:hypothetical protein